MSTQFAQLVPYDVLERDENQPRILFDPKALAEFAESLWYEGIQSPIVATPSGDAYKILHGERRWRASALNRERAALLLEQEPDLPEEHPARRYDGWTLLPVIVNHEEIPSYRRRLLQIGDNENRAGLTLYEKAFAYNKSFEESPFAKAAEFCRAIGMTEKTFSGFKSVLKAHGPAKLALETGVICDIQAFRLFQQLPNEVQEVLIEEANKRETTLGRKYLDEQVETAKAAHQATTAAAIATPADTRASHEEEEERREDDPVPPPAANSPAYPQIDLDALAWLDAHLEQADIPEAEELYRVAAYSAIHEALTSGAALIAIYEPLPAAQKAKAA